MKPKKLRRNPPTKGQAALLKQLGLIVPPTRAAAGSLIRYVHEREFPIGHPGRESAKQATIQYLRMRQEQLIGKLVKAWRLPWFIRCDSDVFYKLGRIEYVFCRSRRQVEAWGRHFDAYGKRFAAAEELMCVIRFSNGKSICMGYLGLEMSALTSQRR